MKILTSLCQSFNNIKKSINAIPAIKRQNDIFDEESRRQKNVGRIEKIEVIYDGKPDKGTIYMNKNLSTPYDAARHFSQLLCKKSALALLDGRTVWDMHRPIEDSCRLNFLSFNDPDPYLVNKAFWKSCSFLLGSVISNAFSDNIQVTLHSFPSPQITSGSFLYDARLSIQEWKPNQNELRILSSEMVKLSNKCLIFERLVLSQELAQEIFIDNEFKMKQIPNIASKANGNVVVYRVGNHIDISKGPLVGDSSFLGRCSITAVHQIQSDDGVLFRFQGVALPKGLLLNHFAYKILEERAAKLNKSTFVEPSLEEQLA